MDRGSTPWLDGARCMEFPRCTYLFANRRVRYRASIPAIRVTKILRRKFIYVLPYTNQFVSQGEAMISPSYRTLPSFLALVLAFLAACAAAVPAGAQEKKLAQTNGVDNSKMGAYRALAQHIYADFQKGDLAGAARSEERRVGKECLTQCRSRWSP